ncbi:uncharacterized protein LOC128987535 [Macrosteles quadrilineatus]|uniref:uncharacterized protein LOC128987535 n=1 Tax=Macrosteles quadrilineatus TaxID=74068 RepID=UPI0023E1D660|nr:uncharacterized protein LOC128987535 [Macrosteles quadrilineatus]XP_054264406.1 uncharacterized protein LOC128987535 [Macrosteles quadrilineatus]XP_054264407.1 uncharacterized protein LOC128987535 [Macrosteles quadrilineatus]XP_054264408.1 uncharacterized protein LOC128987535 [Macrosteles quadrilineatus]
MTQSEENAHEKFTLKYYVRDAVRNTPQKEFIWCLNFATEAHKEQKRKDLEKTPYINHPIGVAYILAEEAGLSNVDLLQGCLLHDTVEDTELTSEVIRAKLGDFIGNLVDEVTDDKSLPKQKRKDLQVVHARSTSPAGKLVKMADKLYNLRDLERQLPEGWSEQRRSEYFEWAFQVCEGLRLRGISPKLEEQLDVIFVKRGLITKREQSESKLSPPWPNHDELKPLLAAANFAAIKHRQHFMFDDSSNVPYINHLVSTTFHVSQDADVEETSVLCAALLKDVVGKGTTSFEEVKEQFGEEVESFVKELTYNHSLPVNEQIKLQIDRAPTLSHHAKVVVLAAMVDACRRLEVCQPETMTETEREEYFRLSQRLSEVISGTDSVLEEDLQLIWVGQGLKEFPMKSNEEPRDLGKNSIFGKNKNSFL